MFWNKYPYTDFHELNLDWLLTTYQKIVDDIKALQDWMAEHKQEYAAAMVRLQAVENEINTFEQRIEREFAQLEAEIRAELEEEQRQVQQLIDETQQEIARRIAEFEQEMEAVKAEFLNMIAEMRAEVMRLIVSIQSILDRNNEFMMEWVRIRLQEFIDSLPDYQNVYVYNPYRGETTLLQLAINDLYSLACIWGLTAAQYDSLKLTAAEYDALGLTATQYDTMGYKLLYADPDHYMYSPFTGEYVHLKVVIMDLASLHMNALTAQEYDDLEIDAEVYDADEITAYNYDWNGKAILTA